MLLYIHKRQKLLKVQTLCSFCFILRLINIWRKPLLFFIFLKCVKWAASSFWGCNQQERQVCIPSVCGRGRGSTFRQRSDENVGRNQLSQFRGNLQFSPHMFLGLSSDQLFFSFILWVRIACIVCLCNVSSFHVDVFCHTSLFVIHLYSF